MRNMPKSHQARDMANEEPVREGTKTRRDARATTVYSDDMGTTGCARAGATSKGRV